MIDYWQLYVPPRKSIFEKHLSASIRVHLRLYVREASFVKREAEWIGAYEFLGGLCGKMSLLSRISRFPGPSFVARDPAGCLLPAGAVVDDDDFGRAFKGHGGDVSGEPGEHERVRSEREISRIH